MLAREAVSDTLTQSALVGTDIPGKLEMLQRATDLEEGSIENTLVVITRSCTQGQPEEDISLVSGVEYHVQEASQKGTNPIS